MMPFKFGATDPGNLTTANAFQAMLLQATGRIDTTSMPSQVAAGEASGAGLSMALSGLMKKSKRTLIHFQEDFLIPFINKAAWRFMQFDPDRYPVKDVEFLPVSTMGMVAREYEQQQMIGLMQTLGNSPITPVLLQGIIQSSSLANREEIVATLQQMSQPDPMAQQMAQLDMAIKQAQLQETQAKAAKAQAEAQKAATEAQLMPMEAEARMIGNISRGSRDSDDFEKRAKIAELALKEADIQSNEKITMMQMATKMQ
jgi:hypothetical protein